LSRAYLHVPSSDNDEDDLEFAVHSLVCDLLVSNSRLSELHSATASDLQMQQLHQYIIDGWPANISNVPLSLRAFWNPQNDLNIAENLILLNNHTVIPVVMRPHVLKCIHQGHMGIEKSKSRARVCVYWPAMYSDIECEVKQCAVCNQYSNANPLLPYPVPAHPWEKVRIDFFARWKRLPTDCGLLFQVS